MAYKRKTRDVFELQGYYCGQWETLTASYEFKEIRQDRRDYIANAPGDQYRIKKTRESLANP